MLDTRIEINVNETKFKELFMSMIFNIWIFRSGIFAGAVSSR